MKKNIAYNLFYQILGIILPFITAPYLSRVIGAEGVGVYSFSHSVALYFTYFTLLGLTNYGNRSIASVQNDREKRSVLFFEIYTMQLMCFFVCISVYLAYTFFFSVDRLSALLMVLMVISSALDINWFFFGMEQFKITVTRNMIIKILTVLSIFLFVRNADDIYAYILIMSASFLVTQLCLWPFLHRFVDLKIPDLKNVLRHFKPNLILFVPVMAVNIYKIMDKIFLGYMSNMSEVGYYENAERIITISVTFITAIGTVMLPRMTALISEHRVVESKQYIDKTMIVVIAYTNAVMFGILAVAREFSILYYGDDFITTGYIMMFLSITVIFLGVGNVVRTQFMIPNHYDKPYLISAVLGAVVNCIINLLLIPRFASIGAAIGTICAEFAVCSYQIYSVRKELKIKQYLNWEIVFALFGLVMYLVIYFIPATSNQVFNLFLHVFTGGAFYVIIATFYILKTLKISLRTLFLYRK